MLAIPLDTATEARLTAAAARLGEAPDALAARAVGSYLEDLEDYARAAAAWAELDPATLTSLDEMKSVIGTKRPFAEVLARIRSRVNYTGPRYDESAWHDAIDRMFRDTRAEDERREGR